MGATKHNTCNYQMNITTICPWLLNKRLTHGMTRKTQYLQMHYYDQYNKVAITCGPQYAINNECL